MFSDLFFLTWKRKIPFVQRTPSHTYTYILHIIATCRRIFVLLSFLFAFSFAAPPLSQLSIQETCTGNPCGEVNEFFCSPGETCTTNTLNQAECVNSSTLSTLSAAVPTTVTTTFVEPIFTTMNMTFVDVNFTTVTSTFV